MVSFSAPMWLLGLLVTPLIVLLGYRNKQQGLIAPHLLREGVESSNKPLWIVCLAWVLTILALSGPHWREQDRPSFEPERARVLVLDMSHAMYVDDISPNRFQQAFYKMSDLVQSLDSGYTGLVAYSAKGYTISPVTHDHNTVLNHMQFLSPEVMPTVGKDAANGVAEAISLLDQAQLGYGDIVLVTSGVSQTEKKGISEALKGSHYSLSTYAISTVSGGEMRDAQGKPYLDKDGEPIISRLEPHRLQDLASSYKGIAVTYQHDQQDIVHLSSFLNQVRTVQELTQGSNSVSEEMINDGYWLLWPLSALLLLAFRKGGVWSLALALFLPLPEAQASALYKNSDRQGYEFFSQKRYQEAATVFDDPAWQGLAHYEAGDYQSAADAFALVKDGSSDYNLGNALARLGQLELAIEKYKQVLARTPDHLGAKTNLARVEEALEAKITEEQAGEPGNEGSADAEQESGEGEGDQEREQESEGESGAEQDNLESDPDSENLAEQTGASDQSGSSDSNSQNSSDPQFSEEGGAEFSPPQNEIGEAGEYESDRFTAGASDIDFGVPTEDDLEAMRHELSQLGEVNPVLNRLTQIEDDRSLLLRNLLLLQQAKKDSSEQSEIEW